MILGFKTIHAITKTPTGFVDKIMDGIKIHTVREGDRWRAGMPIQFATGVRTKAYHKFKDGFTVSVQNIRINPLDRTIWIDGHKLRTWNGDFTFNDGFETAEDFWQWFNKPVTGQIIHWTDFKYIF